jgi:hypothetical protein
MKNNKILLAALAVALVLGMAACNNGSTGTKPPPPPNTDPKTLLITDNPGTLVTDVSFPCYVTVMICTPGAIDSKDMTKLVAGCWWRNFQQTDTQYASYKLDLYLPDGTDNRFTGTGTYEAVFIVSTSEMDGSDVSMASIKAVYGAKSVNITTKETTVSASEFKLIPLS